MNWSSADLPPAEDQARLCLGLSETQPSHFEVCSWIWLISSWVWFSDSEPSFISSRVWFALWAELENRALFFQNNQQVKRFRRILYWALIRDNEGLPSADYEPSLISSRVWFADSELSWKIVRYFSKQPTNKTFQTHLILGLNSGHWGPPFCRLRAEFDFQLSVIFRLRAEFHFQPSVICRLQAELENHALFFKTTHLILDLNSGAMGHRGPPALWK